MGCFDLDLALAPNTQLQLFDSHIAGKLHFQIVRVRVNINVSSVAWETKW
jgi:hypothetical protein